MATNVAAALLLSLVLHAGRIVTAQDTQALLDDCIAQGREAGLAASRGACSVLVNLCPPPLPGVAKIARAERTLDRVTPIVERTCQILFRENCKNSGTGAVETEEFIPEDCKLILRNGPQEGLSPICSNFEQALGIFSDTLEDICNTTPPPSPPPAPPSPPAKKEVLLSRNKRTAQSTTAFNGRSSRAVDGDKNTVYSGRSCTHTGINNRIPFTLFPWWSVDLGSSKKITRVAITNRSDCCSDRLSNFEILVGDQNPRTDGQGALFAADVCAEVDSVGSGETVSFGCAATGRYVSIQIKASAILTLCEVEVFGEE